MIGEIGLALLLVNAASSDPSPHHHGGHGEHNHDHGHNHGESTSCDFVPGHREPDCNLEACKDVSFVRHDENTRCNQYWQCVSVGSAHHRLAMPAPKHGKGGHGHGHHPHPKGKDHHGHNHNSYSGVAQLQTCSSGLAFIENLGRCDDDYHHHCGQICKDGRWTQGKYV